MGEPSSPECAAPCSYFHVPSARLSLLPHRAPPTLNLTSKQPQGITRVSSSLPTNHTPPPSIHSTALGCDCLSCGRRWGCWTCRGRCLVGSECEGIVTCDVTPVTFPTLLCCVVLLRDTSGRTGTSTSGTRFVALEPDEDDIFEFASDWPAGLELRRALQNTRMPSDMLSRMSTRRVSIQSNQLLAHSKTKSFWAPPTLDPESLLSISIDIFSAIVLVVDLFFIPYVLAWDLPMNDFLWGFAWFTSTFWTLDIGRFFLTAVRLDVDGDTVLQT